MTRLKNSKGFTLAEVLIAILIAASVLLGLISTLRAGISAYRRLDETSGEVQEIRLLTAILESDLRNIIFYSGVPFSGEADKISFPTIVDEYEEDSVKKIPAEVTYAYRERTLYRQEVSLRDVFKEKKENAKKMIPSLKSFVIQYAYREKENSEIVWTPSWPKGQGLPRGIQIALILEKKDKQGKLMKENFTITRKFFIPQGNWGWLEKTGLS